MNVIGKYILKNILEKKLRTILIILSIAVSSSLYFASSSITDTMVKMQKERLMGRVGYTDIMVQAWYESPTRYFSQEKIKDLGDNFEYAAGSVSGYGLYKYSNSKTQGISLWGIDYDELNKIAPIDLLEGEGVYPFGGMKIIISTAAANKYNLHAGDPLPIDVNGARHRFLICGIAQMSGPFIADGETICGIVPPDTIRSLYSVRGEIDNLYIKLKNPANKQQIIELLQKRYPRYNVREPFTERELRRQNNKISIPFMALAIILSFMSIYIINSTFRLITFERLPVIGTFRSVGAQKRTTNRMLIMESLIYGIAGGAAGCLLGLIVLYLMSIFTMPVHQEGYRATISFKPMQLLYTFIMSVLMCLISSMMPIIRANRVSVKDVILNNVSNIKTTKAYKGAAGLILISFGIFAPMFVKGRYGVYINALCIVAVIAAVVMTIPFITAWLIKVAEYPYSKVFGNEGTIAVRNLRGNKSINGSISLLAIGISCLLFVNTLSFSTLSEQLNYYERANYQIFMQAKNANKDFIQAIRSTEGVREVSKLMGIGGIDIINKGDAIGLLQGVDTEKYLEYNDIKLNGDPRELMDNLNKGRGILVTNRLRDRFDLKPGDELRLRAWGKESLYKVAGFFESIENSGNFAIIADKYLKLDMGWSDNYYSTLYIKTNKDPEVVMKNLQVKFAKQQPNIITMEEMKSKNMRYNEQIFLIAKGFSIMTMLAGILGIFNNLIINFLQRKRNLAMYRSIGMSKVQIVKMIFIEALTTGIAGSLTGVISGMMMIVSGAGLLKSLEIQTKIHYSGMELSMCLIFGVIIALTASIGPALKSSKLNLMESIKYE